RSRPDENAGSARWGASCPRQGSLLPPISSPVRGPDSLFFRPGDQRTSGIHGRKVHASGYYVQDHPRESQEGGEAVAPHASRQHGRLHTPSPRSTRTSALLVTRRTIAA